MQKLEQFKRREDELLKEKLALQERVGRIEQELEHFQAQLSKSSSSSSEKIGLQKEVATLMKGEIELKN
jgi:dynactin complex subunit